MNRKSAKLEANDSLNFTSNRSKLESVMIRDSKNKNISIKKAERQKSERLLQGNLNQLPSANKRSNLHEPYDIDMITN